MQSMIRLYSNTQSTDIETIDYAIANKLTPFIAMQNHYNIVYREEEREMMPTLKVHYHTILHLLALSQN